MAREAELLCMCNVPYMAGVETPILTEVQRLYSGDVISEAFIDTPWWGVVPLTVRTYDVALYPTFNTWGEIMFDSDRTHFRCGTPTWLGKIMAYVTPVGSRVLTS